MLRAVSGLLAGVLFFPLLCPGRRGRRHRHALSRGRAPAAGEHHRADRGRHRAQRGAHAARAAVRAGRLHHEGPLRQQRRRDLASTCAATASTGTQNTLILIDGRRLNDFDLSGVQWAAIPLADDRAHRDPARHRRGAVRRQRLGRRGQHRDALAAQAGQSMRSSWAAPAATKRSKARSTAATPASASASTRCCTAMSRRATARTTATSSRTPRSTCAGRSARARSTCASAPTSRS